MNRLRLAISVESLGMSLRQALGEAMRLGVAGVQIDAAGNLSPRNLSQSGRRELRHLLRSHNLELSALGCPLRRGLDTEENQQPRLEHVMQVMSLSFELGARLVVVQAGAVPEKDEDPRAAILRESLLALGRHGDKMGATLALETGLEPPERLREFLDRLDTGSLAVALDPANLLMHRHDPYEAVRTLHRRIGCVQAKDARSAGPSRMAQEVPLGHGDIDWIRFLAALEEVGYRGWLTVKRESGDSRAADVAEGVAFLRRLLP
jgi:sugar phosphate isomerase/epimerase